MKFGVLLFAMMALLSNIFADDRGFEVVLKEMKLENRVALVIGNNNYQGALPTLNNAVNDARDIAKILDDRGFHVIPVINATKKMMRRAFREFYHHIANGGVGLVYFAGHGIEFDGKNYLIPINADLENSADAQDEAIALNRIIRRMKVSNNRLNIIILDACRNNPFDRERNVLGKGGLASVNLPKGLYVAYSTDAGRTTSDGDGDNGLYTKHLKYYMQQPLLLDEVFKKTRTAVYNESTKKPKQLPAIYDQVLEGQFYFTLPTPKEEPKPKPIVLKPLQELTPHFTPNFRVFSNIDQQKQNPLNARINIENVGVWSQGMKLKKGSYVLEVSANNYEKKRYRIDVMNSNGYDFVLPFQMPKQKVASGSQWITPTRSVCESNGGEIENGHCRAKWEDAKQICSASGGALPSKEVLGKVVSSCGGVLNDSKKNRQNSAYQSCYKEKGFTSNYYWSSTTYVNVSSFAWGVYFYGANQGMHGKNAHDYVRCVRAGQ
jgi:hypothetical protein